MMGSFASSVACLPLLLTGQRRRSRELAHYLGGRLAGFMYWLLFQPCIIEGLDNMPPPETPCVYVANHQSTVDIAVFYAVRRNFSWVSKASVFTIPGVGLIMRLAGYVSLQRGSKESGKKMLEDCRCVTCTSLNNDITTSQHPLFKYTRIILYRKHLHSL
jgi:1-acyl-sn-glycerol-3-phosphate acyltransferase